ncbi:hypothetical protein GE21DRAFT_6326 [Neurospora crassa]|uniref:Zinc binuclear cluster-type protein n=1 Tax=Neurospora crassa (strain ATCC 24698 / 74-OR23-1A / CBS 708.71 / DSM 1257 / FGSC 987) TaxID=367110 RepID=Q7S8Q2_NEUCR|nr:zinc binuclear cluster-type protein [Neurospora crassa OR74A]EAA32716.2 zinc binuclear cluster-type protein [Neurospora crassa OR74A]KHE82818.1 hypothetical protein GE21DRAFT_6326 [Neurospora crassa]|eukprot:XP_961952.2 zinc binuclear cluster-type protein [Neurospora crassa OR74A]
MDAAEIVRRALGSIAERRSSQQHLHPQPQATPSYFPFPTQQHAAPRPAAPRPPRRDASNLGYTLTACCRCRQRKTRCGTSLPRCMPCERAGAVCEYWDSTLQRKVSRSYVVKLRDKLRRLTDELAQFKTDEPDPQDRRQSPDLSSSLVRPNVTDEISYWFGPSSGVGLQRTLMEEAKRYMESESFANLLSESVTRRVDRANRMQSISTGRKKSYPLISEIPVQQLPKRATADRLLEVYIQRAQIWAPILHEKILEENVNDVYDGDKDPYKRFVVHMVFAIGLRKLSSQFAGLADSFYIAATEYFWQVIQPRDLKSLQCIILLAQYYLLCPYKAPGYYIAGLATKLCQQLNIVDEQTISSGVDEQTLDMRRRLAWVTVNNELGLAYITGRPNGFSKSHDAINLKFFESLPDENITADGIEPGPACVRKLVAIHFCKMTLLQAEIRRVLYEQTMPNVNSEEHCWVAKMQKKLEDWRDSAPEKAEPWCKSLFAFYFHNMMISLYRPSPQIPDPSATAAAKCFDASREVIAISSTQIKASAVDVTYIFLSTIHTALSTLLWSVSYAEVRADHSADEVKDITETALEIFAQCSEFLPEPQAVSEFYDVLISVSLRRYHIKEEPMTPTPGFQHLPNASGFGQPGLLNSNNMSDPGMFATPQATHTPQDEETPIFRAPSFRYVFDGTPEPEPPTDLQNTPFRPSQPMFRSNSIFGSPSTDPGRRLSHWAPESTTSVNHNAPVDAQGPPTGRFEPSISPPTDPSTPIAMPGAFNPPTTLPQAPVHVPVNTLPITTEPLTSYHLAPSPVMPLPQHAPPLIPTTTAQQAWFNPPPPLLSPHTFSSSRGSISISGTANDVMLNPGLGLWLTRFSDNYSLNRGPPPTSNGWGPAWANANNNNSNNNPNGIGAGGGLGMGSPWGAQPPPPHSGSMGGGLPPNNNSNMNNVWATHWSDQRQGSLSQEQQDELMDVLETEGIAEIDMFLKMETS